MMRGEFKCESTNAKIETLRCAGINLIVPVIFKTIFYIPELPVEIFSLEVKTVFNTDQPSKPIVTEAFLEPSVFDIEEVFAEILNKPVVSPTLLEAIKNHDLLCRKVLKIAKKAGYTVENEAVLD